MSKPFFWCIVSRYCTTDGDEKQLKPTLLASANEILLIYTSSTR